MGPLPVLPAHSVLGLGTVPRSSNARSSAKAGGKLSSTLIDVDLLVSQENRTGLEATLINWNTLWSLWLSSVLPQKLPRCPSIAKSQCRTEDVAQWAESLPDVHSLI